MSLALQSCLLFDNRRLCGRLDKLVVAGELARTQGDETGQLPEYTLLLPQRNPYPTYRSGICSAAPLANGGLLTAGHCIQSEWLPGSVLEAGNIAATVWKGTQVSGSNEQPMVNLAAQQTWLTVSLIAGAFKANGPDWALLSSSHNLPGYKLARSTPKLGASCTITGYPQGLSLRHVATAKVIKPLRESPHFFWLACRVSNGVSGAPVTNTNNHLVGIVCGETTTANGIYTRVQKLPIS